ncbi:MAG TPA: HAD-IA family hydrolase [Candidatus Dormibacteraeota bacterium]|nr:HAD-IA family hydrolase [Candidatus Dormibacteraeota bacterium]
MSGLSGEGTSPPRLRAGSALAALRDPSLPPLRTVFFDLGDTLMYVHPDVPTLYLQTCREMGIAVSTEQMAGALHAGERMYRGALRAGRTFESSMDEARSFWQQYNELILAELGVADRVPERARELSERFWHPGSWRVFAEVHDVLRALRAAGLQLAVISNFTDALVALCETHELDGYFDVLVASTVTGSQKPDAGIFREALRRTGANPATSLHVGDNYVADILGARASGIPGILLDRSRAGVPGMFDFALRDGIGGTAGVTMDCPVIADLGELLTLVER